MDLPSHTFSLIKINNYSPQNAFWQLFLSAASLVHCFSESKDWQRNKQVANLIFSPGDLIAYPEVQHAQSDPAIEGLIEEKNEEIRSFVSFALLERLFVLQDNLFAAVYFSNNSSCYFIHSKRIATSIQYHNNTSKTLSFCIYTISPSG